MDKTINLISLKKVQSFCEKYFDKRIFCHKFDVFFLTICGKTFFLFVTTYLPKI